MIVNFNIYSCSVEVKKADPTKKNSLIWHCLQPFTFSFFISGIPYRHYFLQHPQCDLCNYENRYEIKANVCISDYKPVF